jgi:hypothetical protein
LTAARRPATLYRATGRVTEPAPRRAASRSSASVGTPTAYYVGAYGRLRTVTKVQGADQLWLSTTNCDNNGGRRQDR